MTTLLEHQFEILPSAEANDGFVFGAGDLVSVNADGFDPGENEWITQDGQNERRGIRGFGRDVLGPKTWVWESFANTESLSQAVDVLEDFSAAWAPEELVRQPGLQTALRYRLRGRDRRIFGRPRRYAAPPTNQILNGMVDVTHDFALVDAYTYDDIASVENISFTGGAPTGGFVLPATMPVSTDPSLGNGGSTIAVGGNARAFPVIRLGGPWINPEFITANWSLKWTGSILPGGYIEIDLRPWNLTVLDQNGASQVGGIGRQTWFEDCWFAPGQQHEITLGGDASGGTASAIVTWRNTWTSI